MNFICNPCKSAADINEASLVSIYRRKQAAHKLCKGGTQCDCQHRVEDN